MSQPNGDYLVRLRHYAGGFRLPPNVKLREVAAADMARRLDAVIRESGVGDRIRIRIEVECANEAHDHSVWQKGDSAVSVSDKVFGE